MKKKERKKIERKRGCFIDQNPTPTIEEGNQAEAMEVFKKKLKPKTYYIEDEEKGVKSTLTSTHNPYYKFS